MSRINSNIPSLQAMTRFAKNSADLNTHLERLSSGLRINRGKDAPAGLIGSETLRSEIQGIRQGIDNTTRANNVINTAEGALGEASSLLLELQSLTNEAANTGALSLQEIQANQLQVDSILNSINRIANTTQFNGVKLLNGQLDYTTSGVASTTIDTLQINAAKLPDNGFQTVTVEVTGSAQLGNVDFTGTDIGTSAVTIEVGGNDGTEQLSFAANTATSAVAYAVNNLTGSTGVSAIASGSTLRFSSIAYGESQFVSVKTLQGTFTDGKDYGQDATVSVNGTSASVDGLNVSVRSGDFDVELKLDAAFGTTVSTTGTSFAITGGGAKFQIGSKVQRQGQIQIGIGAVATTKLGNDVVGYLSSIGSDGNNSLVGGNTIQAQKVLDAAIKQVATLRGRLGAFQKNIVETNVSSLNVALENVTAAESSIRDADFAVESARLTRAQILVQSGTSVLAIANQNP
ncbi:MAG: flagellin, partial [Burkholderiales bacterium]|nr:flagellin [Phycisphaerae bacterium]